MLTPSTSPSPSTKCCSKCAEVKPTTEFYSKGNGRLRADCKACSKAHLDARKEANLVAGIVCSVDGCGREPFAKGLCQPCYKRDRYGDCEVPGCPVYANDTQGLCSKHKDRGTCEHPSGCGNRANSRHGGKGPLLCQKHRNHASGYCNPREHDRSNDPHVGYLWYHPNGTIAYVGITSRKKVKYRTAEHLNKPKWPTHKAIPPSGPFIEFDNEADALRWEEHTIKALVKAGAMLYNDKHNVKRNWWKTEK